jgi:hypothetical protein
MTPTEMRELAKRMAAAAALEGLSRQLRGDLALASLLIRTLLTEKIIKGTVELPSIDPDFR